MYQNQISQIPDRASFFSIIAHPLIFFHTMLFLAMLVVTTAIAETTIDMGNGAALRFEFGSFSQDNTKADLEKITIIQDGAILLTAESLSYQTYQLDGVTILATSSAEDVSFDAPDIIVKASSVKARNLPLTEETARQARIASQSPLFVQAEDVSILVKKEPFLKIDVGTFELDEGTGLINPPPQSTTFAISDIQITSQKNVAFMAGLSLLGLTELSLDLTGSAQTRAHNQLVFLQSNFHIDFTKLGSLTFSSEVSGSKDAITTLLTAQQQAPEQLISSLNSGWNDITFNNAEIEIADEGLLAHLETSGQIPPPKQLAASLSASASLFLPVNGTRIAGPIGDFLVKSGNLIISFYPEVAPQFNDFPELANSPDELIDQLGIDVSHRL